MPTSNLITEKYTHYGFSQIEPLDSTGIKSTRSLGGLSLEGFDLLIFMLTYMAMLGKEGRLRASAHHGARGKNYHLFPAKGIMLQKGYKAALLLQKLK